MSNEDSRALTALCEKLNQIDERDQRVVVAFCDGVLIGREIGKVDAVKESENNGTH